MTRAAAATLHDWFSLDGNPDPDKTWTTTTLEYLDDDGKRQAAGRCR